MKCWKASRYTSFIRDDLGNVILHNSFMGAVAKVPSARIPELDLYLKKGMDETALSHPPLKELCDQGFFVESVVDERTVVEDLLHQERESRFGLMILPHEDCNFRCQYCYEKHDRGRMAPDVVKGLKNLISIKAGGYRGISVNWFGGEPLLANDIILDLSNSFIDVCKRRGIPYSSSITTNGFLLNPLVVDGLLSSEVKHFQITIDGPQPYHDLRRPLRNGQGTYRQIIANLTHMKNRADNFTVRIRINFDKALVPQIERWLGEEIAPLLGNDPRFHLMFFAAQKWGGPNDGSVEVCDNEMAESAIRTFDARSLSMGFSDAMVKEVLRPHGLVCYASRESMIIVGADGTIYKCSVHFSDSRNCVGKLAPDGSINLDRPRWQLWVNPEGIDTSSCANCRIFPICQSRRCPYSAMNEGKPTCAVSAKHFEHAIRLIADSRHRDQ